MIGILDSGIGGLVVAGSIMRRLPGYAITYFGDTARAPYGNKSPGVFVEHVLQGAGFLVESGAQVLVMACNTSSSAAARRVRESFDIPVLDVITPAVRAAVNTTRKSRIGVMGTRTTAASGVHEKKNQAA